MVGVIALAGTAPARSDAATNTLAPYTIGAAATRELNADWKLAITGSWPTQCPPTLENVSLDGADLRVNARAVLGLCTRTATPFSIEVDPALALDRKTLPSAVYHVSFYAADGAQANAKLRAFTLIDRSPADAPAVIPETGFWWSADGTDRNMLSVELQGTQISVAWMSYDSNGQPQWHFGAAPYAGRIAHVPLLRLQGGSEPFAASTTAPASGESTLALDLEFHSAAHASAWLSRSEGSADDAALRLRSFDIVRLPLAENTDGRAWQGNWVLVGASSTQRLHFDRFSAVDTEHFELTDSAQNIALVCTHDATYTDLPPSSCSLRQSDGTSVTLFDSVAISRMDGSGSDGAPAHLLRVTD